MMTRHRETTEKLNAAMHSDTQWHPCVECGHDKEMFDLLEKGDERIFLNFFLFLNALWKASKSEVVVVTSRLWPCMMLYYLLGRDDKLCNLRAFANACDALASTPGAIIPVLNQAHLTSWKVIFNDAGYVIAVELVRA